MISTDDVGPRERFAYWHEVICGAFVRLQSEVLPCDGPFRAAIDGALLGPLTISRVNAMPHAVHRTPSIISAEPRDEVLLSLQLSSQCIVRQDDRAAVLGPGDFALYDATRPYDLTMPQSFDMLVFQFERSFLLERCPAPEALTAIRMPGSGPISAAVSAFLRSLEPVAHRTNSSLSPQLATHALDLVGLALADQFGSDAAPGASRTKHFLRACAYINAHANDPDLDPTAVASAIGVSLRYLHQLFHERDTTVIRYLLGRRLANCHADLRSLQHANRTVLDIATSHGFKTSAHFARCFKERYGVTPSEVRAKAPRLPLA